MSRRRRRRPGRREKLFVAALVAQLDEIAYDAHLDDVDYARHPIVAELIALEAVEALADVLERDERLTRTHLAEEVLDAEPSDHWGARAGLPCPGGDGGAGPRGRLVVGRRTPRRRRQRPTLSCRRRGSGPAGIDAIAAIAAESTNLTYAP